MEDWEWECIDTKRRIKGVNETFSNQTSKYRVPTQSIQTERALWGPQPIGSTLYYSFRFLASQLFATVMFDSTMMGCNTIGTIDWQSCKSSRLDLTRLLVDKPLLQD
jgi:hypothetical protein